MKPAFQLPFKCGQVWRASTYDGHSPDANALDFGKHHNNTNVSADEDVLASAAGTVDDAYDTDSESPPYGGVVIIQHEGAWQTHYLHLDNALSVKKGDKVVRGQKIGVVGGKIPVFGTANAHLHYSQWKGSRAVRATFNGVDTAVHAGARSPDGQYPTQRLISANCPVPPFGPFVSAVSRDPRSLDVCAIGRDGRFLAAAWKHPVLDGKWRGWWHIRGHVAPGGAAPAAVSRDANKLDVFVVGDDGTVHTAAWDEKVGDAEWRGWWPIGGITAPDGCPLGAVSRAQDKLDVFVVARDGLIYTAAWEQDVSQGNWRGWWNIGGLTVAPGSPVCAVPRDPNKLDVFVVGLDRRVYTAAWDQHVSQGRWRGWWRIGDITFPPRSTVSVVSRDPNKLDVFAVRDDGRVYTAAWDQHVANAQWRGWWKIGDITAGPGSPVGVVSRDPNKLDVFVVGFDGRVHTAAWDQHVTQAKWRGWWSIQSVRNWPRGGPVVAVSRDPNKLDVFAVGKDGTVYTAAWDQNVAQGKWRGWWRIDP